MYYLFFLSDTSKNLDLQGHRVVFFDGSGSIFRNQGDIFTYIPHNDVRNLTAFFFDNELRIEYDYHLRTNNLGLVQDVDTIAERESLLLLGDSFTEGQGAEQWEPASGSGLSSKSTWQRITFASAR